MDMQNKQQIFLKKIDLELNRIRQYMKNSTNKNHRENFLKFEKLYQKIQLEFQNNKEVFYLEDLKTLYSSLLKSAKKLKREIENSDKFTKTDIQSFLDKYDQENVELIPLIGMLKKNQVSKMQGFDFEFATDYQFQILDYTNKELVQIALQMIEQNGFLQQFNIDNEQFQQLLLTISKNYNVIPYHNWSHAFNVFQMLHYCYQKSDFKNYVEPLEIFTGMVASLAHDLNHKGVNNMYKIKKQSSKCILYSERSVLENMHCSIFFSIIQNPKLNILSRIQDQAQAKNFKSILVSSILATDMEKHGKLLEKLKRRVEATEEIRRQIQENTIINNKSLEFQYMKDQAFDKAKQSDRLFLLNIMIHACDISNPCLKFDTYMNWSFLVSQEFMDQTKKEAQNNLPVTTFLQYKNLATFYGGQIFFSKVLVYPLWNSIGIIFPNLKIFSDNLLENCKILAEKQKEAQDQLAQEQK